MKTKTITLSIDQWEMIREVVESYRYRGPYGEGWQNHELSSVSFMLSSALDEAPWSDGA